MRTVPTTLLHMHCSAPRSTPMLVVMFLDLFFRLAQ